MFSSGCRPGLLMKLQFCALAMPLLYPTPTFTSRYSSSSPDIESPPEFRCCSYYEGSCVRHATIPVYNLTTNRRNLQCLTSDNSLKFGSTHYLRNCKKPNLNSASLHLSRFLHSNKITNIQKNSQAQINLLWLYFLYIRIPQIMLISLRISQCPFYSVQRRFCYLPVSYRRKFRATV